jgi:hypothetical protein
VKAMMIAGKAIISLAVSLRMNCYFSGACSKNVIWDFVFLTRDFNPQGIGR